MWEILVKFITWKQDLRFFYSILFVMDTGYANVHMDKHTVQANEKKKFATQQLSVWFDHKS